MRNAEVISSRKVVFRGRSGSIEGAVFKVNDKGTVKDVFLPYPPVSPEMKSTISVSRSQFRVSESSF